LFLFLRELAHILSSMDLRCNSNFAVVCDLLHKSEGKSLFEQLPKMEETVSLPVRQFYTLKIMLTEQERLQLCQETLLQASSSVWRSERKKRISATRAHRIVKARSQQTALKYFFEDLSYNAHFEYGIKMEPLAKESVKAILNVAVIDVGLVTRKNQPWLCASPDGIVQLETGELAVLEIKCPSSCAGKSITVPYLEHGQLKKSHPYYTQIQIQLYCCELNSAILFVFSEADQQVVKIDKDPFFLFNIIPKLEKFYFEQILPVLAGRAQSSCT
jgi:hypothetical protein